MHAHLTLTLLIYYSTFLFFYFRWIRSDGSSFTGGYKQGYRNGKGEYEFEDGRRVIAYWVDDYEKEGSAKYYDENGNEYGIFCKNNKLVGDSGNFIGSESSESSSSSEDSED